MRYFSKVLHQHLPILFVILGLGGCKSVQQKEGSQLASGLDSAYHQCLSSPNDLGTYRTNPITSGVLKKKQIVITIDEVPHPPNRFVDSDRLARKLEEKDVSAVFFVVGDRFAKISPRPQSSIGTIESVQKEGLQNIVNSGHYVANHSFSHTYPNSTKQIPGLLPSFGYDQLFNSEEQKLAMKREVVWTNQAISEALGGTNPKILRWFRPPGGKWAGKRQACYLYAHFTVGKLFEKPAYWAPLGWSVPVPGGEVDFNCRGRKSASQCANSYMNQLSKAGGKGVILFHGNLVSGNNNYSLDTILAFVDKARAAGYHIVDPKCLINGCD